MKVTAIVLFVLTYVLLLALPKWRAYVAVLSGAAFVFLGLVPLGKVMALIQWNVIFMIAGTMGLVALFIESNMPALLGDLIIERVPNVKWAIVSLSVFSGFISAFIDNVATVLIVVPVALVITKRLNISPVYSVIAISISSNLQGAATLVGDTTSILLGGQAEMDFFDFFWYEGKPGLFWIVQLSAVAATLVLFVFFRKETGSVAAGARTKVEDYVPSVLLCLTIAMLVVASFVPNKPEITNGAICMILFFVGLLYDMAKKKTAKQVGKIVAEIDFFTLLLLAGLFVVVGGLTEVGVVEDLSKIFVQMGGGNLFLIYTMLVWFSVVISAFIDNIPYMATMLPVVAGIAGVMGVSPTVLYFGLISGATLGGNITPIGASANITSLGILRKEGYGVSTGAFMKMSLPFTLAAVTVGYGLVWLLYR